ncbi:hypothetical protein D3C74_423450 [compost metagenome]
MPALVHDLTAATSVHACSVTPERIVPAVTLLHEQTVASSGSSSPAAPPPDEPSGSRNAPGSPGSSRPTMGRSDAYGVASPTNTPPRRVRASSDRTSFL